MNTLLICAYAVTATALISEETEAKPNVPLGGALQSRRSLTPGCNQAEQQKTGGKGGQKAGGGGGPGGPGGGGGGMEAMKAAAEAKMAEMAKKMEEMKNKGY